MTKGNTHLIKSLLSTSEMPGPVQAAGMEKKMLMVWGRWNGAHFFKDRP